MKRAFYNFINLGIEEFHSSHEQRRIKTINLLNLIVVISLLIGFCNYFILKTEFTLIPSLIFISFAVLSILFSKYRKTNISFLIFTLNVNFSIFFINKCYPFDVSSYVFYFPLIVSIVLLNKPSIRDRYAFTHFSICVISFAAALFLDVPEWRIKNLDVSQTKQLLLLNLTISATLTGLMSGLLNRLISNQNNEILLQNEDLKHAKKEIDVSLKEKEVLLAELHHRVKNNLAIISGLLNLQVDATANEEAKQIISDSKNRIMSMALVHKMLYKSPELKSIDLGKYTSELIFELFNSYDLINKISINENYDQVVLPINKSIPLGLILNEIVTNSIKYVYKAKDNEGGIFCVTLKKEGHKVLLTVKDSGSGFPKDLDFESQNVSLGIFLIKTLAEQIDGNASFSNENGAKIELTFSTN